jgi:ribokinase
MMKQRIVIIGSSNTDMVIKSKKLPAPGETIIGGTFLMNSGGKGANQAVAASRLGADVTFVSKTGNDIFGKQTVQSLQREGINTDFIFTDLENPSGVALILVDAKGENSISVASGANGNLQIKEVEKAIEQITPNDIVLLQLEIPISTVEFTIKKCFEKGAKVILNPAPAQVLDESIFKYLDLITPNETEAALLTGIKVIDLNTAEQAALKFYEKGVKNVIITLGASGAYLHNQTVNQLIPAPVVEATDTTAAGDIFNGALAVALSENQDLEQAVRFACRVAAISVTKMGAQASAPKRNELN